MRARPPTKRAHRAALLLSAAAAWCAFGVAGCTTTAGDADAVPVGSIQPTAEMVPWRSALQEAQPAEQQRQAARPAVATVSPFAMDDGDAATAMVSGGAQSFYASIDGEAFPVPAVPLQTIDPAFVRATVDYATDEPAGTIVVDPAAHYLYFIEGDGTATRYGVGVGREGFGWAGEAVIADKRPWPNWYPPKEMIGRQPALRASLIPLEGGVGMAGGPANPLGARALYLWQGGRDTLYRIHGTTDPASIGKSVSSGCIRMINQDVIHLYGRVREGARVVVLGGG